MEPTNIVLGVLVRALPSENKTKIIIKILYSTKLLRHLEYIGFQAFFLKKTNHYYLHLIKQF